MKLIGKVETVSKKKLDRVLSISFLKTVAITTNVKIKWHCLLWWKSLILSIVDTS